jgi:hypothetical protein
MGRQSKREDEQVPEVKATGANTGSAGVETTDMNINEGSAGSGNKKDQRKPKPVETTKES